jgi:hypothetical protein
MLNQSLQYPIGKFIAQNTYTAADITEKIQTIEQLPEKIELAYALLTKRNQLDVPYRPQGWTTRQVIHHLADSHMNAYIRVKWTLTENSPVIKAYNQQAWAETPEVNHAPALSVALLKSLHAKWTLLLKNLSAEDLLKSFIHPETGKPVRLDSMIALYAWHGEHHLAHLNLVLSQESNL